MNTLGLRSLKILSKIAGLVLFACVLLRNQQITCIISAITFIFYVFNSIVIEKDKLMLKYLHIFLSTLFFLIGVFVCDNGKLWLGEINSTTFYCGAFNILAFYYWIFYSFLGFVDPFFTKLTQKTHLGIGFGNISLTNRIYRYGSLIVFITGLLLFLSVIRNPSFGGNYVNRLDYALNNVGRFVNIFRVFPALFSVLLIPRFLNKEKKVNWINILKLIVIPYIPYILFLIWTGNKYGAFVELVYLFVIPFFSNRKLNMDIIKKIFKIALIVCVPLIVVLFLYYILTGSTFKSAINLIGIRIACQGELWWKLIALTKYNGFNIDLITEELARIGNSILTEASVKNYGIYHLMDILGAPAVVSYYETLGTRFTAAGIELPFYCMGYLSFVIIPLLYCPFIAYITNVYINSVKEKRVVASITSARLLQISLSAMQQGDWYMYFSAIPLCFTILLILSQCMASPVKKYERCMRFRK